MNQAMKDNIRAKVNSYLKRAEEIKHPSKDEPRKKKAVADSGNSKDNKDDDDSGDPDKKRMMQKFEGTFYDNKFFISSTLTRPLIQELLSPIQK
jgi:hypothetical protein